MKLFKRKHKKTRDELLLEKYNKGEVLIIDGKTENKVYPVDPNFPKK